MCLFCTTPKMKMWASLASSVVNCQITANENYNKCYKMNLQTQHSLSHYLLVNVSFDLCCHSIVKKHSVLLRLTFLFYFQGHTSICPSSLPLAPCSHHRSQYLRAVCPTSSPEQKRMGSELILDTVPPPPRSFYTCSKSQHYPAFLIHVLDQSNILICPDNTTSPPSATLCLFKRPKEGHSDPLCTSSDINFSWAVKKNKISTK